MGHLVMAKAMKAMKVAKPMKIKSFARTTTLTLKSMKDAGACDALVKKALQVYKKQKMKGYKGAERFLCGMKGTYRGNTFWKSIKDMKAAMKSEAYINVIKGVVKYAKKGELHTQ